MEALRESRRTATLTITSARTGHTDVIRLCDPECRDAELLDWGLKGSGGGHAFRSHGEADAHRDWNDSDYHLEWKRGRPTALPCDGCGDSWRQRPGPPKRELSEAQRAVLARNAGRGFFRSSSAA